MLDILSWPADRLGGHVYNYVLTRQYMSLTPQVVSTWCRQLGHEVHYATYYGFGDPLKALPADLEVVFIACYSRVSALAYALAKVYRMRGALTVIGGPHAKAFPLDCLRFFDVVVKECDKELVRAVLNREFSPGSVACAPKPFSDVPTVEERLPDIRKAAYLAGRWPCYSAVIPMLTSTGCPYNCNFCIDWNNSYRVLPLDQLAEDMRFIAKRCPRTVVAFHDPNFAIKFDQVVDTLTGALPPRSRPRYAMEVSLTVLRGDRIDRLAQSGCVMAAPGVESWTQYGEKAGVGRNAGWEKVERVAQQFEQLYEKIPYLQANFMFGLDSDAGEEPIQMTKEFMRRTPFVWPALNIPHPFGGTPLQRDYLAAGRVLEAMPFTFYYMPYLVTTIKNYDPEAYYRKLIDLVEFAGSAEMLRARLSRSRNRKASVVHRVRTLGIGSDSYQLRSILRRLQSDRQFRDFHAGESNELPEYYHREFERTLGKYAPLVSRSERRPVLHDAPPAAVVSA